MGKNIFETLVGALVLAVAVGFVIIAYQSGSVTATDGYELTAKFDRVDGLNVGSDVRVSGLKVGSVVNQHIDPATYLAIVTLTIDDKVKIPKDSIAEIVSNGLLGGKYLALVPGGDEAMFADGEEIRFTQPSISIESLIGKFLFGGSDDGDDAATEGDSSKDEDDIF